MSSSSTAPPSHPNVSVLTEVLTGAKEDTKQSLCAEVGLLVDTELDSLTLNITHKLITNQNLIIISQSSSSSATAPQSCLNMTELRRLLVEEKDASKVSFRADLNRRVEPLVESLFKRMTNKTLELDLARLDLGNGAAGGDRAQAVDSVGGRSDSSPRVSPITHSPTCSSAIGQLGPFKSQPMGPVCNCPHPPKGTDVLPKVKEEEDTSKMNSAKVTQLVESKVKEEEDEDNQADGVIRGSDHSQVDDGRYEVITQSNLDNGQLLSNPSLDTQNASNSNESIEEGGTNLSCDLHNTITSNEPNEGTTVTQSVDLLSPSTSTAHDSSRTALNQQATQLNKRKQPTSIRTGKRSKIILQVEDGVDGEGGDEIVNEDREEAKFKILHLNCTESNCNVKLDSLDHLRVHLSTVHRLAPLQCFAQDCDARFDNRRQVRDHIKLHHSQVIRFVCAVCSKEYGSQGNAYLHWYNYHLTGQFKCNFVSGCAQVSDTRAKMRSHQQAKHYSQSKHFH